MGNRDYITDEIVIGADGEQEVITNILDGESVNKTSPPTPPNEAALTQVTVTVTNASQQKENIQVETAANHQLTEEWVRIAQLGALDKPHDEVCWTN